MPTLDSPGSASVAARHRKFFYRSINRAFSFSVSKEISMASALVHRINNLALMVALGAIVIAVTVFDFGITKRMPDAHAAADRQLNKELVKERVTCEKWRNGAGSENFTACIADLKDIRVKHDKRGANDLGNHRGGLPILW
jgi:hypothetical protein